MFAIKKFILKPERHQLARSKSWGFFDTHRWCDPKLERSWARWEAWISPFSGSTSSEIRSLWAWVSSAETWTDQMIEHDPGMRYSIFTVSWKQKIQEWNFTSTWSRYPSSPLTEISSGRNWPRCHISSQQTWRQYWDLNALRTLSIQNLDLFWLRSQWPTSEAPRVEEVTQDQADLVRLATPWLGAIE